MWRHEDIEQPPPTPGLAQWAWNSLFNKQTPMSKYNAMKNSQNQQQRSYPVDEDTQDLAAKDDTFHYKRSSNHKQPHYSTRDDTEMRKNVSWGGKNYSTQAHPSDILREDVHQQRTESSRGRSRDRDFYIENSLLPDPEDDEKEGGDFTFTPRRPSSLRRSHSASYLDRNRPVHQHTSLPQAYPGRFPSPYVHKDDILSSGTKNLMTADSNAERNKHIPVGSSPPVPSSDWQRRLGLASQPKALRKSMTSDTSPVRSVASQRHYQQQQQDPSSSKPISNNSTIPMLRRKKALDNYSPTLDQNDILRQLDRNGLELEEITSQINNLKTNDRLSGANQSYNRGIEVKYKRVREELIIELKKSQKLYDSYYRFMGKYKDLKTKYENAIKDPESSQKMRSLEKEILLLRDENQFLKDRMNEKDVKLQEDDFTLNDLKSTLQNSSKFEVTLRRKIRYMEDKLEQERQECKTKEFQLKEKIYMLEMKAKEDEERLKKAEERIKDLESSYDNFTPLRDAHSYSRTHKRSQRPLSMSSLGHVHVGPASTTDGFKYGSKYTSTIPSSSLHKENFDDLHEDTIDRLIKETL